MGVLVTIVVLCVGFMALIPVLSVGLAIVAMGACFLVWLLPILLIANSERTTGAEKAGWILAIIFLSWFAWIFYLLLAPLKPRRSHYYLYE
jgi:hypothetical protein